MAQTATLHKIRSHEHDSCCPCCGAAAKTVRQPELGRNSLAHGFGAQIEQCLGYKSDNTGARDMRSTLAGVLLLVLGGLLYVATPFWAAWTLREAVRTRDTATLERKVEWDSVRRTLKASLAQHARLVPEINPDNELAKPGMWQRVKMAFGQSLLDGFVDRYVTPAGLPQLFEHRHTYSKTLRREPDEAETLSRWGRFQRFWARLKRAEFQTFTRIELELEDRRNPERRYVSVLQLEGLEWRLVGLRIVAAADPNMGLPARERARAASVLAGR